MHVTILGATGYTGGLVARELAGRGHYLVLTGRNTTRLARLRAEVPGADTAVVDVSDRNRLRQVLAPGAVAINCAGPFTDLGESVVEASIATGTHYLDTTGEQPFMKAVEDRFHDRAREAGVAVVNAMAFEFALGDCAAALAADGLERPLRRLDAVYGWRADASTTTPGTRASILRVVARRGWALEDGRWDREPVARRTARVRLPEDGPFSAISFPAGEVVTAPRHLDVETVRGWIVTGRATAAVAGALSPLLPPLARAFLPILDPIVRRGSAGPDAEQRAGGRFDLVLSAVGDGGDRRTIAVRGRDPYGLTAAILGEGVDALASRGGPGATASRTGEAGDDGGGGGTGRIGGVLAPAQLVDPEGLLDALREDGLEWGEAPEWDLSESG